MRAGAPPSSSAPSRITALEPQQKREGRVSVFIDGTFALGIFADVAVALGLRIGQRIAPERLEEIAKAETQRRAIEDAYHLLSFRARSEGEIAERLERKGYEEAVITETLRRLREAGYLDDASFAERWVASRGATRGRRALAQELRQKGVDGETAAAALDAAKGEEAERESARETAVRKVGEHPADTSREARARLAAYLQRRGFGWDVIRPVLTELYRAQESDPDDAENEDG